MKNLFLQKKSGFCSVYTIANLFQSVDALRFLDDPDFEGCDDAKETLILQAVDGNFGLTAITFSDANYPPVPPEFVFDILMNDNKSTRPSDASIKIPLIPHLLTVRLTETAEKLHRVAVIRYQDILLYSDPYWEDMKVCRTMQELYQNFCAVYGVDRLILKESKEYMLLIGENLKGYETLCFNQSKIIL
jgi:hypothetical protein